MFLPRHVATADWQRAIEDGRCFLIEWGARTEALGWTEADIVGLPPIPPNTYPSWQRLARLDRLGLIWVLRGSRVTSINTESAAIATLSGGEVAFYRFPTAAVGVPTSEYCRDGMLASTHAGKTYQRTPGSGTCRSMSK